MPTLIPASGTPSARAGAVAENKPVKTGTFWRSVRRNANPHLVIGLCLVVPLVLIALVGPILNLGNPFKTNTAITLAGPGEGSLLGTDENGRDVFIRIMYGLRTSLIVAVASTLIGAVIGTVGGMVAGYYRGWLELVIMRLADLILVFPAILVAITIVSFLSGSVLNLVIVCSIVVMPFFARIIHASTLGESQREFVEAARAIGAKNGRIIFKHILPNVLTPLFIELALTLGRVILIETGLSFLGLGAPPPEPTLGIMVSKARTYMSLEPTLLIFPAVILALLVIGFNMTVDGLRDVFDPRFRRR